MNLKRYFINLKFLKEFFIITGFIVVGILISYVVGFGAYNIIKFDNITFLLGCIALIFSISGILFSASRSALADYERRIFYEKAKQLLQSGILLVLSLIILYILNAFKLIDILYTEFKGGVSILVFCLVNIPFIIYSSLFLLALIHASVAISRVFTIIFDFDRHTDTTIEERAYLYQLNGLRKTINKNKEYNFKIKKISLSITTNFKVDDQIISKLVTVTIESKNQFTTEFKNYIESVNLLGSQYEHIKFEHIFGHYIVVRVLKHETLDFTTSIAHMEQLFKNTLDSFIELQKQNLSVIHS